MTTAQQDLEALGYQQQLNRSLNVWQLTGLGLNYMIPLAPAIVFGLVMVASGGTVALPYLLGFIGMSFTAVSYAILVPNFPLAGSLYSYVSRGFNPHIGFIAGWALLLDYIFIPTVTAISAAVYLHQFFPLISYDLWLIIFIAVTGSLNIFGVRLMANMGLWFLLIGEIIVFTALAVWLHAVAIKGVGVGHVFSLEPFKFTNLSSLMAATSLAVMCYLGFDAITTFSEEAKNPKRDIPRAIYMSVIFGACTMFLTGYVAMLVIPNWHQYVAKPGWVDSALFQVAKMTGGTWFASFYTAGFVLAMGVFNIVATAAGARLLYGMGRDEVLPKKVFAAINQRWKTPHWNIILIIIIECSMGILLSLDLVAELVNFGALLGFILLNVAAIWLYYVKRKGCAPQKLGGHAPWQPPVWTSLKYFIAPLLGIIVIGWVFLSLSMTALIVGGIWVLIGIIYGGVKTNAYRSLPPGLKMS